MKINCSSKWIKKVFALWLVSATLLFLPAMASATNVNVDCSGQTPGAFTSLQAAIDSLDVTGPHFVGVAGTCTENITIFNRQRITIFPLGGETATISAANPAAVVVHIFDSQGITLSNLVLQGGSIGLLVNEGSVVNLRDCTVQDNSKTGVGVQIKSVLAMDTSNTIQNNGGTGLTDGGGSSVTLSTLPAQQIKILGNGGGGIAIDGSYLQVNFGSLDVENNLGAAIQQTGGRLLVSGGQSANVFQGNGVGINIFNSGSATFSGKNTIRNNGQVGLQILGSSVAFNGSVLPDGTLNATVIEGHSTMGVNVVRGELGMTGPHLIQNNGSATADPTLRGGMRVSRGSLTLQSGVQITANTGPGIRSDFNSGTLVMNISISNNSEEGVHVGRQSVSEFIPPFTIAGNGGASVSCDTTSLLFGDLTGVTGLDCLRIERSQGPPRGGEVVTND